MPPSAFRCRFDVPAPLLAVSWFGLYVFAIGSLVVLAGWLQNIVLPGHPLTPAKPALLDTISVISIFLLNAVFWRSSVYSKSDLSRFIEQTGGSLMIARHRGRAKISEVSLEIKLDRSFLDYWPHPRGTQVEIVCGKEIVRGVGGYNPRYMRRMSTLKFSMEISAPNSKYIHLCSANYASFDDDVMTLRWRRELDATFGNEFGDWEIEVGEDDIALSIRSGSWEGVAFEKKVRSALEIIRRMCWEISAGCRKSLVHGPNT